MGQTIKVQRPVSSASISGLYVILEAAFTIALLGLLLYNILYNERVDNLPVCQALCEGWHFTCMSGFVWGLTIYLYVRLCVRVDHLLTCGKHMHDGIISLRGDVCAQKTSLTLPLFIEVSVPSQESERSCTSICVRSVDVASF